MQNYPLLIAVASHVRYGVSNYFLFKHSFRLTTKRTMLSLSGDGFPPQRANTVKSVSKSWRNNGCKNASPIGSIMITAWFSDCLVACQTVSHHISHITLELFSVGRVVQICEHDWQHEYFVLENGLTHWGRVTHICVGKLTIIGSDNGLSPGRRQAIIWTNAGILSIEPLGTNFSEILIGIQIFSLKKMRLKMSSAKWRPFCLGLNVLRNVVCCVRICLKFRQACFIKNSHVTKKSSWMNFMKFSLK